jgi:hypothetical protein
LFSPQISLGNSRHPNRKYQNDSGRFSCGVPHNPSIGSAGRTHIYADNPNARAGVTAQYCFPAARISLELRIRLLIFTAGYGLAETQPEIPAV